MPETPAIADETYISFTTYKKDGTPRPVPVWVVPVGDGRVGFSTEAGSWKVRRIRNDARVAVQASNSRGQVKPGSVERTGTAEIVTGAELDTITSKLKEKYRWWWYPIRFFYWVMNTVKRAEREGEVGIVVTFDDVAQDGRETPTAD